MSRTNEMSDGKYISDPKAVHPLSIENLSELVAYSPNATKPTSLISQVNLPAGSPFTTITAFRIVVTKQWSTLQISRDQHIELNSALLYMNHSCSPSLELDVGMMEIRVAKEQDLNVGDELTFFYPSTEWSMDRPFTCLCMGAGCLGVITGASEIDVEVLKRRFINEHIVKLKLEHDLNDPKGQVARARSEK